MRWFRIRKAKIPKDRREDFESVGVLSIQLMLAVEVIANIYPPPKYEEKPFFDVDFKFDVKKILSESQYEMRDWLIEQFDRQERRETWLIMMEAAITAFVFA